MTGTINLADYFFQGDDFNLEERCVNDPSLG
jgi:hypothetical protein